MSVSPAGQVLAVLRRHPVTPRRHDDALAARFDLAVNETLQVKRRAGAWCAALAAGRRATGTRSATGGSPGSAGMVSCGDDNTCAFVFRVKRGIRIRFANWMGLV